MEVGKDRSLCKPRGKGVGGDTYYAKKERKKEIRNSLI